MNIGLSEEFLSQIEKMQTEIAMLQAKIVYLETMLEAIIRKIEPQSKEGE